MKKTSKRILAGFGAIMLILAILSVVYFLVARTVINEMITTETGLIGGNVYAVKDTYVNFYLIKNGDTYIAIDAGNKRANILKGLDKLAIEPGKISAVLLTHSDRDHVSGISLFKNAGVYLSKQEEQMINGNKSRFFFFNNGIDTQRYQLIEDMQILNFGNIKIQGILTPGHTPGSMCYLINDTLLFVGDALRLENGKVEKFVEFINMDSETATQSIGKIIEIPGVKYVYTAHYGYTDDVEKASSDWR